MSEKYGTPSRPYSNPGTPYEVNYSVKLEKDGTINLTEDGKIDLYAQIQSHKDSCSIELALKRFALGDESALQRTQGAFGDFTVFPNTFAEVLQVMIDSRAYFDSLPVEARRNFDFDFNKFISSLDDPVSMGQKLGFPSLKDTEVVATAVKPAVDSAMEVNTGES